MGHSSIHFCARRTRLDFDDEINRFLKYTRGRSNRAPGPDCGSEKGCPADRPPRCGRIRARFDDAAAAAAVWPRLHKYVVSSVPNNPPCESNENILDFSLTNVCRKREIMPFLFPRTFQKFLNHDSSGFFYFSKSEKLRRRKSDDRLYIAWFMQEAAARCIPQQELRRWVSHKKSPPFFLVHTPSFTLFPGWREQSTFFSLVSSARFRGMWLHYNFDVLGKWRDICSVLLLCNCYTIALVIKFSILMLDKTKWKKKNF